MLTVMTQDAAERHRRYWTTTVWVSDKINCYILIKRMKWANKVIKYLPCMKYVKNTPSGGWPIMNVPFSKIELCIHIIATLPLDLVIA